MDQKNQVFSVYRIANKIYLFLFEDSYDLCMHFLRYQEFYESPKFRGQSFTIIEFMEWYAKTYGKGSFTYTNDWAGFNIPGNVVWKVHTQAITDFNKYDAVMLRTYNKLCCLENNSDFYILGCTKANLHVLRHELCHGMYFTDDEFRAKAIKCVFSLPEEARKTTITALTKLGYAENVLEDELIAYFSTGLLKELQQYEPLTQPFKSLFEKFAQNASLTLNKMSKINFDKIDNRKTINAKLN